MNESKAIESMELCIRGIRTWVWMDKLKLNDDKTELMIIGSREQLEKVSVAELSVGDTSVASPNLKFDAQITKTYCTGYYYLHIIRKIRKYLTLGSTKCFLHTLVMGCVDCNSFLYSLSRDTNINKLQRLQKMAPRLINNKYSAVLSDHTCSVSVTLVTNKFQD